MSLSSVFFFCILVCGTWFSMTYVCSDAGIWMLLSLFYLSSCLATPTLTINVSRISREYPEIESILPAFVGKHYNVPGRCVFFVYLE